MRKSELALTAGLIASAAVSVWLWGELRDERARNAELEARATSLPARIPAPAVESTPQVAPALAATPTPGPSPAVDSTSTQVARAIQSTQEDPRAQLRRMLQDPKYRENWRAQQRLSHALRRDNFIRLLGLTPEQADAIVELELDRRLRAYERTPPDPPTPEYVQQRAALDEQEKIEAQARLRELLGEEKRAKLQEYMESRATRMQVDRFRPQFTGADALRDDQVEPLIAALHVERKQMQQSLDEYEEESARTGTNDWQKRGERRIEELKAAHARMHSAAAPILSGSQLEKLDALLKRELEMTEAQQRLRRLQVDAEQTVTFN